ncbi:MAG: type VI secretion system baseplate subunit TssE [Planctomycetota bacterium]
MARVRETQPLLPSVFDRLLDDDPFNSKEVPKNRNQVLRELKASVRRDLESLLNTPQAWLTWPSSLDELDNSVLAYGIPDFTGVNMSAKSERKRLIEAVERCIQRFEPRFRSVRVALNNRSEDLERTLRFRIEGTLYAEPAPEPVVFDSVVEPLSAEVAVSLGYA